MHRLVLGSVCSQQAPHACACVCRVQEAPHHAINELPIVEDRHDDLEPRCAQTRLSLIRRCVNLDAVRQLTARWLVGPHRARTPRIEERKAPADITFRLLAAALASTVSTARKTVWL